MFNCFFLYIKCVVLYYNTMITLKNYPETLFLPTWPWACMMYITQDQYLKCIPYIHDLIWFIWKIQSYNDFSYLVSYSSLVQIWTWMIYPLLIPRLCFCPRGPAMYGQPAAALALKRLMQWAALSHGWSSGADQTFVSVLGYLRSLYETRLVQIFT